jgi:hypothetical protein
VDKYMKIFRVNNEEYEIYLSSNGMCLIEDMLGVPFQSLDLTKLGYKSIVILLYGMLWQKSRLSFEKVNDLLDDWLSNENNDMKKLGSIVRDEIEKWASKIKSKDNNVEIEKKN